MYNCCKLDSYACVCVCVFQHMLVVCVRHTAAIMRHLNPSFTCVCVCVCVCPSTWWWCVYATLLLL